MGMPKFALKLQVFFKRALSLATPVPSEYFDRIANMDWTNGTIVYTFRKYGVCNLDRNNQRDRNRLLSSPKYSSRELSRWQLPYLLNISIQLQIWIEPTVQLYTTFRKYGVGCLDWNRQTDAKSLLSNSKCSSRILSLFPDTASGALRYPYGWLSPKHKYCNS